MQRFSWKHYMILQIWLRSLFSPCSCSRRWQARKDVIVMWCARPEQTPGSSIRYSQALPYLGEKHMNTNNIWLLPSTRLFKKGLPIYDKQLFPFLSYIPSMLGFLSMSDYSCMDFKLSFPAGYVSISYNCIIQVRNCITASWVYSWLHVVWYVCSALSSGMLS